MQEHDSRKLRSWLPKTSVFGAMKLPSFYLVVMALFFVVLIGFLTSSPSGGVSRSGGDETNLWEFFATIAPVGFSIASVFLGFVLSRWWSDYQQGDHRRLETIRIDDEIEEEIQSISEDWQQVLNSMNLTNPTPEFLRAARFLLSAQLNSVRGRMQRMALEIDKLGYLSIDFLDEKRQRFVQIREKIDELITVLPEDANPQDIGKIFDIMTVRIEEGVGDLPVPSQLEEHDVQAEVQEPNLSPTQ